MKKSKFKVEAFQNGALGTVNIKIIDVIGSWGNDTTTLSELVNDALAKGITKAEVFISSAGGSTIEAQGIAIELKRFESVNITVGALAASAATYLLTQFPASAYPESQFMIHKPSLDTYGTVEEIKADLKLLENTEQVYRTAYAKAFNKTEAEIDELWKNDYWMTAQEAKDLGLIQNIIQADIPWDESVTAMLTACGAPKILDKKQPKQNEMNRDKIIAAVGLAADASDEQIETAIKNLKAKAGVSDQLKNKLDEAQKQKVKNLVADAVAKKKITADQVSQYEKLATADYEATEQVLEAMPEVKALSGEITEPQNGTPEDRSNWTYEDYLDKAPQAFEDLMAKDQSKAMNIFNNRRK